MDSATSESIFDHCNIFENNAKGAYTIALISSFLTIRNDTKFYHNTATGSSAGIFSLKSILTI